MLSAREVNQIREGNITNKRFRELTYHVFLTHIEYSIAVLAANQDIGGLQIQIDKRDRAKFCRVRDELENLGYVTNFSYFPSCNNKLDLCIKLQICD